MIRRKLGFTDEAERDLEQALTHVRAVHNPRRESAIQNNLGLIADGEAEDARGAAAIAAADRAVRAYRASLALLTEQDTADRAQTLSNIGVAFRRHVLAGGSRAFLDSADNAYAAAAVVQATLKDPLGRARLRHNKALILRDRGDFAGALVGLRQALTELRGAKDAWWEAVTLRELADTYRAMGAPQHTVALAYYDSAARSFEQLSGHTGDDASRAAYQDQKAALSLYEHWILASLDATAAGASPDVACESFAIAERARAQALRALMSAAVTRREPGESLATPGARELCRTAGHPALAYFETSDTLLVWLSDGEGAMHVGRVPVGRDSIQSLIAEARWAVGVDDERAGGTAPPAPDSATNDTMTPGGARPPVTSGESRAGVTAARGAAAADGGSAALAALATVLLPSGIRERLPVHGTLLVVPHGNIALVPFVALPRLTTDTTTLGARLSLVYAPSADVARLAESLPSDRIRRGDPGASLVAGDPVMPRALDDAGQPVRLASLPGARAEATSVAARLGVNALVQGQATEHEIRSRLPSARLVHLASHGIAYSSDARAEDSFIALAPGGAPGKSEADTDGHLTVRELLSDPALRLQADLVVLSACETALGRLRQSEGTLGLQRAFLARGARSVLVSLWRVDDRATRLLMDRFYAHWLDEHTTKAEALRLAQQDVRMKGYAAPKFWAAFQLVGAE
jgi:tetratricopeptide (TPR) repeat protein